MASESCDPLSYLAGDSSSSESDDGDEEEEKRKSLTDKSYYVPSTAQLNPDKDTLPSPDTVFASVQTPYFLTTHIPSSNVNWDKLAKTITPDSLEPNPHTTNTHAAIPPPPPEIDSTSEISAAPVRYSIDSAIDPKMVTVSNDVSNVEFGKAGEKRAKETKGGPTTKKMKGEIFREKEKRKRDLGMSSRGKSFVEEEKRILREKFDK